MEMVLIRLLMCIQVGVKFDYPYHLSKKAYSNISSSVSIIKSYEKVINTGYYEIFAIHALSLVDW